MELKVRAIRAGMCWLNAAFRVTRGETCSVELKQLAAANIG